MTRNIGSADRIVRLMAGLALVSLIFLLEGDLRWIGLVGLVPLATALLRWYPLYSVFGVSSCGVRDRFERRA